MTMQLTATSRPSHPVLRSISAVVGGFLTIAVLSTVTDQIFHATGVFPPDGQPMYNDGLMALALGYRIVFGLMAGFVTAWLAPRRPMRHALVLGLIGFALSSGGATVMWNMGPHWYAIAVILISIPCALFGALIHRTVSAAR
jgi:uncharacterized membrane protein YeaQ/YmgE (transglycosylase-associated protein family)